MRPMKRIGVALSREHGLSNRRYVYGIYRAIEGLCVMYEGYRIHDMGKEVMYGLPMSGPHNAYNQITIPFDAAQYAEVRYFNE